MMNEQSIKDMVIRAITGLTDEQCAEILDLLKERDAQNEET